MYIYVKEAVGAFWLSWAYWS